jgi:hypothetical protein
MTYDRHLGCRSLTHAWRRALTRATQPGREPHASDAEGNIRFDFQLREGQTIKVLALRRSRGSTRATGRQR